MQSDFLGPLLLGHLFDTLGRRKMISGTYLLSGVLLAISAWLFNAGLDGDDADDRLVRDLLLRLGRGQFGLPHGERDLPLEVRAMAIAVFFSIAQCFGPLGPVLYGWLIGDGSNPTKLFYGYLLAAGVMIIGGVVEIFLGIDAENKASR